MTDAISITWDELSSSTQAAFQFAAGIATGPERQGSEATVPVPAVSSRMLLVGIADAHPDPASVNRNNPLLDLLAHYSLGRVDMDAELAAEWRTRTIPWNPARHRRFTLVDLPPLRGHAPQVMQAARELMLGVQNPPKRLPLRCLFGGIVMVPESGAFRSLQSLLGHRTNLPAIREAYPEFLELPDDVRFADFLGDRFPSTAPFAGTAADRVVGVDLLGRGKLIGDVARWLSVQNLQTPLAIGLFGDWGSGKSFFMARLQEEIDRISKGARRRRESAFCPHIVQVNFNAWLYSDSEIWPSLASQVFKAVAGVDPEAPGASSMEELRAYWAKETTGYRAAEQHMQEAVEREAQARQSVRQLDDQVREAHDELLKSAKKLGPDAMKAVEAGHALKKDAKTTASAIKGFSTRTKVVLTVLALVGLVAAAVALIAPSVYASVVAIVALAVPFAGTVTNVVSAIQAALNRYRKEQFLRAEQRAARQKLQAATTTREEAESEVKVLSRIGVMEAYSSGQAELWASRQRLGEVTEIRQSFAELSSIITQTQRERKARLSRNAPAPEDANADGGSQADAPPIDRIVVYIDDLDRCRPDLVVRVLEACKLLMDLEHFVVIVGVDSRWLLRSLEIRFKELLSADGPASADADADGGWAATPQNYLEKIFQFSLMLPRITREGYERLVLALFRSEHEGPDDGEDESAGTFRAPGRKEGRDGQANASLETREDESAAYSADDDRLADLILRTQELETIQALAPLIQTPRSVKRLTNIYRLIRVTYGESHLLQDDSYVVVLLLLGIIVGYPRQSSALLTELDKSDPATEWDAFVRGLEPVPDPDGENRSYRNNIRASMSEAEAEDWARIWYDLQEITTSGQWNVRPVAFRDWLQRVAEYTFHPWSRRELATFHPTAVHGAGEESAAPL